MRALEFITGNVIYNPTYTYKFQLKTTQVTTNGTDLRGMIDYFVYFCCFPVLLPTIYFMRNPKHLISVLHDHNLISECITKLSE